ncbi:MAG: response regulator [Deltaproteobacteria bacterium]|nr:response regulator [Deltaproteobacteria bacterium]
MARIIVIDDSWLLRLRIRKILETADYEVEEAEGGNEGMDKIREGSFDCAIVDLLMPDVSGQDVLRSIRDENINIPVIVSTADIQVSTRKNCEELGAVAFFPKPPQEDPLLLAVKQAIEYKTQ